MRDFRLYLKDILEAMESIESFVSGMDFEAFKADDKTSSAVMRKLEVIGEATKQIPNDVREQYPEVPWKAMAGMRDRLIHFYFGVSNRLVWRAVQKEIPKAKPHIQQIVKDKT